ncbi:hypothetical protein IJH10_00385 [Candidatus Saccharibacteria bacterium]|nr:hypothetical protein [Candidatus Saccharibacteria bacterium]
MLRKVQKAAKNSILFAIKWRYLIALIVFVLCVVLKLHGSSIAIYDDMFTSSEQPGSSSVIAGKPRTIRSDEWLVHTPYYMSQAYNNFEKDSNAMSLGGQDMIIGYNAPVLDITVLGKPFVWGYILLGNEYGLSWYWCLKLILIILVSFELCMILTKKNKKISVFGAILISFAPLVQWWFVPHIVDVIFWGMTILVLAYHFLVAKGWKRNLMMVLLPLSLVTFALALFPSLQIPIALLDIALLVAFLLRDKKEITFQKKDIWRILVIAAYVIAVLGYTIITSKDAILALYNTAYPGKRVSLGGNYTLEALFTNLVTFTLPFKDVTYLNNCEVSNFIHFAPILLMLYPIIWKNNKRDKNMVVGNILLASLSVMVVFMLAGFPELLAKLTFFSYINRMDIVYGFAATLFTIWGLNIIWSSRKSFSWKQIFLPLLIYAALYICFISKEDLTYLRWWQYLINISGLTFLSWLMLTKHQTSFLVLTSLLVLVSGATVNPIARGVSPLFSHPLEKKISELAKSDKDAYWLAEGDTRLTAIGIANGAKVLNAVNFYPDFKKWSLIDESGQFKDVYNRYAHIVVQLTDNETQFIPGPTADIFTLKLNYEDSLKWPIKYIVSPSELLEKQTIYDKIYEDTEGKYYIYERTDDEITH